MTLHVKVDFIVYGGTFFVFSDYVKAVPLASRARVFLIFYPRFNRSWRRWPNARASWELAGLRASRVSNVFRQRAWNSSSLVPYGKWKTPMLPTHVKKRLLKNELWKRLQRCMLSMKMQQTIQSWLRRVQCGSKEVASQGGKVTS